MHAAAGRTREVGPFRVFPLCLGANVFGWTSPEHEAHAVLDAYVDAGGNFVDTADSYSHWAEGHVGGESEAIIGRWLARRRRREELVLATKVGRKPGRERLDRPTMRLALEESLRRLGTDTVDLWLLHRDDREASLEEVVATIAEAREEGKVRAFGVSNFSPARLERLIETCRRLDVAGPVALQPQYNLMDRDRYEGELQAVARRHGLAAVPFFGLARGFLTGKYRVGGAPVDSPREPIAAAYLREPRGPRALAVLDRIAAEHGVPVASVALAWLVRQPTVAAPSASARTVAQLEDLLPMATLELSDTEIALLSRSTRDPGKSAP